MSTHQVDKHKVACILLSAKKVGLVPKLSVNAPDGDDQNKKVGAQGRQ